MRYIGMYSRVSHLEREEALGWVLRLHQTADMYCVHKTHVGIVSAASRAQRVDSPIICLFPPFLRKLEFNRGFEGPQGLQAKALGGASVSVLRTEETIVLSTMLLIKIALWSIILHGETAEQGDADRIDPPCLQNSGSLAPPKRIILGAIGVPKVGGRCVLCRFDIVRIRCAGVRVAYR